jgi:membrane associated rhomboid family serine protease
MIPLRDDNPTRIMPFVTVSLIAVNLLIFLYQVSLGPRAEKLLIYQFGAIPSVIAGSAVLPSQMAVVPPVLSIFTSMFLHGSILHLAGNMLYLWIFGNNIEEALGHMRFLVFYLVCGFAASMVHVLSNVDSSFPTIGASGAISGVLGAYLLLYPRAQVLTLVPLFIIMPIIYIPAGVVLSLWFLLQLVNGSMSQGDPGAGIAWWAHIGGFVAGMLLVGLFKKRGVRFFNPPQYHASRYHEW